MASKAASGFGSGLGLAQLFQGLLQRLLLLGIQGDHFLQHLGLL